MIDSHCHLDHEPLLENLDEVIKRSKEVGLTKLLTICTTLDSFNRIKEIIKEIQLYMEHLESILMKLTKIYQ